MEMSSCVSGVCGPIVDNRLEEEKPGGKLSYWPYMGAMVLSAASAGFGFVMSKGVVEHIPPLTLMIVQLTVSVALFWTIIIVRGLRLQLRKEIVLLALTGLLAPGLANTLSLFGLSFTTASVASLIWAAEPIIILGLAWVILRERVTRGLVAFSIFAIIGALFVVGTDINAVQKGFQMGAFITLAGVFFCALYTVLTRNAAKEHNPFLIVALQQTVALVWVFFLWPIELFNGETAGLAALDLGIWAWAVASGIVQYSLGYGFYIVGLKKTPASLAGLFLNLIPVFSVSGAYIFLSERLMPAQWVGAIVTILAVTTLLWLRGRDVSPTRETNLGEIPAGSGM